MRLQTLISFSIALFLGLMSFVFINTEAAPVKMKSMGVTSARPAVLQTAQVNIIKAVLKPARTKGKLTLKITLHNPTATRATAFTVQATYQRRVIGKTNLNGLNPRARITRTLRLNLPKQKGQPCVTVKLTKPRGSKLKLGTSRRVCLKSAMMIRGIGTSPSRKVGTQGKLRNKPRIGTKGATRTVKRKGRKRLGKYTRKGLSGIKYALGPGSLMVNGSTGPVSVAPGNAINVTWNLSSADNPNNTGIYLLISDVSGTDGNCAATAPYLSTALGSNDEGHKAGTPTGNYTLSDFSNFQVGRTYYIKGCLWNLGGNPEYSGEETNVVRVQYQNALPKPDLTVTDMFIEGSWVVFTVKNSGNGVKLPTSASIGGFPPRIRYKPIKYEILKTLPGSGGGYSTSTINGSSQSLGRAALAPGQTINVKTSLLGYMRPNWQVRVCVNTDRTQSESNYSNNCLTKLGSEIERKSYDVFVTLFKIDVHDSGDNVSPGDWRVTLYTAGGGNRSGVHSPSKQTIVYWPNENDTTNVRSGRSYYPRLVLSHTNVKANETLEMGMLVVECDSGIDLPPLSTILNIIMSPCSGEEIWELSGKDSHVFVYPINIAPADWQQSGKIITRRVTKGEIDATFHFKVYGAY